MADSKDVGIGKVKEVHALGTLMVVFRGHDGKVAVLGTTSVRVCVCCGPTQ